ncbi:MAG: non-canonical purine NTP pyrophosphatase [Candidatus Dojkabacteria bacterium]|jgi:XTP/dITP diphosphohydrolase
MKQIRFATTNDYKIKFANNLLNKHGWEAVPFEITLIEPQSMTQEEISQFKVKQAYEKSQEPIITMDSGLFINALNGFPGIYTSDMFKTLSQEQFLKLLEGIEDRTAYIQQTLAYADQDGIQIFTSKSTGIVVPIEEMKEGYAFDAFFKADITGKLMVDMSEDEKGLVWGKAWDKLAEFLNR